MRLAEGTRFELTGEAQLFLLEKGSVELYAVTEQQQDYRQFFLLEKQAGDALFPALDEFGRIKFFIYTLTETTLRVYQWDELPPQHLRELMQGWLTGWRDLSWVRRLADLGDDLLVAWTDGSVLQETAEDRLGAEFQENQSIFSMLLGMRFKAEDKEWQDRVVQRQQQKRKLVAEGIDCLLGKKQTHYEKQVSHAKVSQVVFIVQQAASALRLPADNIHLSGELAKRMQPEKILRRLIQKGNMQLRLVKLESGWYRQDSGVLIGYYGKKAEPVVLVQDSPGVYRMISEQQPQGIPLTETEERELHGTAYVCYPGLPRRQLKIKDLLLFMFQQCWKKDYGTIIGASLLGSLMPLLTPIVTETIFQDIIPIQDRLGLATVTQVMMVAAFTMAAVGIVRSVAVLRITTHLDIAAEAALWSRLLSLPTRFFRRFTTGELASRMNGINAIKSVVNGEFVATIFNTLFSFWSLFLMCWYSVKLAAAALAVWGVYCLVTVYIYRRVLSFQRREIKAGNEYAGIVQQIFSGLPKFRIQGAEEQAYHLWSKYFGEMWKWNLKLRWQGNYNMIIGSIEPFILTLALFYVALYGMSTVNPDGTRTLGISYPEFLAFSAAYGTFNGSLHALIPLVGTFFSIQPHIENLRPILNELPEVDEDKIDADILTGAVEVSHLSFSYHREGPEVLHDLSFKIKAGETVAIVGRSGCGKSTLVRLLLGFEQPDKGSVYYDGQDLSSLSLPSVRSQMGIVLQNGQLMTGDIFSNIIGTANLTQEEAWAAAEAAGLAEDIRRMPMGMQTVISEGSSNISGGQRQRILIARALASRPAFVIFDEATSALDNRTQAIVTDSLSKLHVTRIVVAHRLSTIREADRIMVMDAGNIVETGTFEELLAKNGIFASLVKRQVA